MSKIKIKALYCEQNNRGFYSTIINSEILGKMCFVSRRDEDPNKGFQRVLNEVRAKDIAKYLDVDKGSIPTAIILSSQDNAQLQFDKNTSEMVFDIVEYGFLVIDGQHRLYGLLKAENKYDIPVVIFNKLNSSDEVNLFIDINTTQRGVPTTLLLDIKDLAGKETKKEEKQRDLFDRLNKESVLAGLLSPAKSKVGKISRVTFNQATSEIFENSFFQDKTLDILFKGIKNYLEAVEKVFIQSKSKKAKLTSSVLFRAVFILFNDITEKSLRDFGDLKVEHLQIILEPISKLNYEVYTGTNTSTVYKIISDMKKEINQYHKIATSSQFDIF